MRRTPAPMVSGPALPEPTLAMVQAAPVPVAVVAADEPGTVLTVNEALTELLGATADELAGIALPSLIVPGPGGTAPAWADLRAGKSTDLAMAGPGRTPVPVRVTVTGDAPAVVWIEDRRDVVSLQDRATHLSSMFQDVSDVILVLGPAGEIRWASPSADRTYGYRPEEWIGRNAFDLVHPDDIDRVIDNHLHPSFGPVARDPVEFRVIDAAGRWRVAESLATIRWDGDEPAEVVVAIRDITERRLAEADLEASRTEVERYTNRLEASNRELQEAHRAAVEASRAKDEFLSRMSHELRTPLNSILGFAQLLRLGDLDPDDTEEALDLILGSGRHLLGLINEVLEITRIEAGSLALSCEPVDARALTEHAVDVLRPEAAARSIAIEVEPADSGSAPLAVQADHQRLLQVLLNLLSNSVKYNHPGGSVTVGIDAADGRVAIRVRDTGPGIAAENHERAFIPFDRLGAAAEGVEGTGIGLSLSRALAQHMGGTLTLDSELGHGATFTIDLPASRDALTPITPAAPTAPAHGRVDDRTVLYIDDNPVNVRLVEQVLATRRGIRLLTAPDGRSGLDRVGAAHPDLVLLDLHLPDVTGREVLATLRSDPATSDVPVAIVSADATPGVVDELLAAGADAYLTKPLDLAGLLETVGRLTARADG